jgi:E3 ubiquitin-protein ligase UBR4
MFHTNMQVAKTNIPVVFHVYVVLQVLAIYTYTKRVNLEDFEHKQRKAQGYSTVSHFNTVHVDCHLAAVRFVI